MKYNILITISIILSILLMSIGYSALNTDLSISGEALVAPNRTIKVSSVTLKSFSYGSYEIYSPTFTNDQTNLSVFLPYGTSNIVYEIEITNETDYYYHLDTINELLYSNPNIKYEFVDEEILHFNPNSVTTIEVKFSYNTAFSEDTSLYVNLEYDFVRVNYEVLDYITSTGSQYIDTGVLNDGDYAFESEFLPSFSAKNEGFWLFSGRKETSYTLGLYFYVSSTYNYTINTYGGNTTPYTNYRLEKNIWYDMYFSRSSFTINDLSIPVATKSLIPESNATTILLGGNILNWDGTIDTRHFEGNIKYFKITDVTTDELLRYFIPVKLLDTGEICYIDIIEHKFYYNLGTGDFIAP